MDKPEKLATLGTKDTERRHTKQNTICAGHHHAQDKDKQNKKHNAICGGHHYMQSKYT